MHAIHCNSATSKKNNSALQNKTTNYSIWIAKVQIKVEFITTFGETISNRRVNRQKGKKFTAKTFEISWLTKDTSRRAFSKKSLSATSTSLVAYASI